VGNIHDPEADSTFCHCCDQLLIGRDWYQLTSWNLTPDGACDRCESPCAGVFEAKPGMRGPRRLPVRLETMA